MKEKSVLGILIGIGSYILGRITLVTVVFFILMIFDFITGVLGSKAADEIYDPKKAEKGIYKKLGYLIFWVLGVLVELIIAEQGSLIGVTINIPVVSLVVTAYLIGTEGLSVMANLNKMGVRIPKWFSTYFEKLKDVKPKDEIQGSED